MKFQKQKVFITAENQENTKESPKRGIKGMWMMALCCGAPILGVLAIGALGIQSVILDNLVLLACPIGMGVMMLMMRSKRGENVSQTGHACCPPMPEKEEKVPVPLEENK